MYDRTLKTLFQRFQHAEYYITHIFSVRVCVCVFFFNKVAILQSGHNLSRIMRKPDFVICENKGASKLCGNRGAAQRDCFRFIDITIPLHLHI